MVCASPTLKFGCWVWACDERKKLWKFFRVLANLFKTKPVSHLFLRSMDSVLKSIPRPDANDAAHRRQHFHVSLGPTMSHAIRGLLKCGGLVCLLCARAGPCLPSVFLSHRVCILFLFLSLSRAAVIAPASWRMLPDAGTRRVPDEAPTARCQAPGRHVKDSIRQL